MSKILDTLLNHERYQTISFIIAFAVLLWFLGCESQTPSIMHPETKVTRAELEMEIDTFMAHATLRYDSLDQQDELRKLLADSALLVASGGTINYTGLIPTVFSILGVGAIADNVRKRKELKAKAP